ncbi:MAG TPA: DNA polymerase III subunit gamma/tau, partial [Planctomycetota bacterium]|nr:DNA polymerase III subunit gamma/tau [Planctomycetota bacterium]
MSHLVLSRKYRPQRFEDLVGQEAIARTLGQAIRSGRIGHAYLFIGPRGTGKTTTARIFAKALNCETGPTPQPCGTCDSCRGIASGNDLDVVEMDAASNNGVEDVRSLRDSVGYRPARSRFRVWIVDEVHMLSTAAFNAFLKTLEEPPPQAKFLFCTTEAHKLPETFLSRVQRLEFRRIDEAQMADRLRALVAREGLSVEDGVCERIAAGALGGLRDAESLLEQLLSCARDGRVTLDDLDAVQGRAPTARIRAFFDAVLAGDAAAALDATGACLGDGSKPDVVLDQWIEELRGLLVVAARMGAPARVGPAAPMGRTPSAGSEPRTAEADATPEAGAMARTFGLPRIARSIDLLLEKRRHLRDGADGRLVAEVAAVELARLPSARDLDAVIEALRAGAGTASARVAAPGSTPTGPARGPAPAPEGASRPAGGPSSQDPSGREAPGRTSPPARPAHDGGAASSTSIATGVVAAAGGCATAAGTPSYEDVATRWAELLQLAGRSRLLGAALARARLVAITGDAVVVAVPDGDPVGRDTLRRREAAESFREAAREIFGVPLR